MADRSSGMFWIIDSNPRTHDPMIWHNGQTGGYAAFFALYPQARKAVIVLIAFMKLLRSPPLTWIFAGAGLLWLTLLFGLSFTDYATRLGFPLQP